jgi:hypothetical protein
MGTPAPARNDANAHTFLNMLEDLECTICEESFSATHAATILPGCRHIYGFECLRRWILSNNQGHNKCPTCQAVMFDDGLPVGKEDNAAAALPVVEMLREQLRGHTGTPVRAARPTLGWNGAAAFGIAQGPGQMSRNIPRRGSGHVNPFIHYHGPTAQPLDNSMPRTYLDHAHGRTLDQILGPHGLDHDPATNAPPSQSNRLPPTLQAQSNLQAQQQARQTAAHQQIYNQLYATQAASYGVPVPPNSHGFNFAHPPAAPQRPWMLNTPFMPPSHSYTHPVPTLAAEAQAYPDINLTASELEDIFAAYPTPAPRMRFPYPSIPDGADLMHYLTSVHGYVHPHPAGGMRGAWPYEYPAMLQDQIDNMQEQDPGLYRLAQDIVTWRRLRKIGIMCQHDDRADLDVQAVRRGLCGDGWGLENQE